MTATQGALQGSTLRDHLHVLRRRKWLLLQAIVLVPAAAVAFSLQQEKRYEAIAEVLVSRQSLAAALTGTPDSLAAQSPDRVVQTQADLARVPEVARRVLRALGLDASDAGRLLAASEVAAKPNSDLLVFKVRDGSASLAARLATQYADEFTAYRTELDTAALQRARGELEERLRSLESGDASTSGLYASLVEKEQQLRTLEALQTSNAALVQPAERAQLVEPRPVRNGVLGLVLGLALGLGLAFLREALDTRVRTAEEIGDHLGLPLLARLPAPPAKLHKDGKLVMFAEPAGVRAESFRMLRTNLDLARLDRDVRTVMVTSAVEREGKSTTAANLAIAFARSGQRVVLVDLDLRRPYLHRFFHMRGRVGVTHVALGVARLDDAMNSIAVKPNALGKGNNGRVESTLSVVPAGLMPPDPGEFVATETLDRMLAELREEADLVIVDAPPLLHVGDALVLAGKVDALLVVTRLNVVRRHMLTELRRLLDSTATRKLGFVVTGAESEAEYGYGSYSGYATAPSQWEPVS